MTTLICLALAGLLGTLFGNWRVALIAGAIGAAIVSPFTTAIGMAAGVAMARRRWPS